MFLDLQTLSVVTVFVTALLGALLVFAGLQNRSGRAPVWWGAAYIVGALGLGLVATRGVAPDVVSIDLANVLVFLSFGLVWAGAREFDGRKIRPLPVLIAPALWILACRIPAFAADINLRIIVASAMLAVLVAMTAHEFWRSRSEQLMSRGPTVFVLVAYAVTILARIPVAVLSPITGNSLVTGLSFALLSFGTLLFTVILAFLLLNMTKERTELKHKIAALVDPLTGIANRRAFLGGSEALFRQQTISKEPLVILLFDLDHFKEINDRFGHALGDRVLRTFAEGAARTLGEDVLFGRIGGEEFAALLPAGDIGGAVAIADRVRRNFQAAAARLGDVHLRPTVSVGVALSADPRHDLDALLAEADIALYRAKANGRNCIEAAEPAEEEDAELVACAPSIIPIMQMDRSREVADQPRPWHRAATS